jgi:hypothetical protein
MVLCGCEASQCTLREEQRFNVSQNKEVRRIFGPENEEITGRWKENKIMSSSIICTPHQLLLR